MIELAEVLATHWPEYRRRFGEKILPSHQRAVQAILSCRTAALGGETYRCDDCDHFHFAYHSCNHRACPKCGHRNATLWLALDAGQGSGIFPARTGPGAAFPHASASGTANFPELFAQVPTAVWRQDWVVDIQTVGSGLPVLKYLANYVYKTAFSSQRILSDDGHQITFSYKDSKDGQWKPARVTPQEFIRRFLQHVLPRGFQRVRYFGWLSPAAKTKRQRIFALLDWKAPALPPPTPYLCPSAPIVKSPCTTSVVSFEDLPDPVKVIPPLPSLVACEIKFAHPHCPTSFAQRQKPPALSSLLLVWRSPGIVDGEGAGRQNFPLTPPSSEDPPANMSQGFPQLQKQIASLLRARSTLDSIDAPHAVASTKI